MSLLFFLKPIYGEYGKEDALQPIVVDAALLEPKRVKRIRRERVYKIVTKGRTVEAIEAPSFTFDDEDELLMFMMMQ